MRIKQYFLTFCAWLTVAACSTNDPKAKLAELKKQQANLAAEIKILTESLAASSADLPAQKQQVVSVQTLQPMLFAHELNLQGSLISDNNITVSAPIAGNILTVAVKEGDWVTKRQVLAQLDNSVLLANIEEVKNALTLARTTFDKQAQLWKQNIGTEMQYLTAENQQQSLERKLETLNQQLALTTLTSPISGIVDQVFAKVGMLALPGTLAFRIVNTKHLKARAQVSESYVALIKKADKVKVVFPDLGNKEIVAKVSFVSATIDPKTRSFMVDVALPTDAALRPNMLAVLHITDYSQPKALVVPVNILQHKGGEARILLAEKSGNKWMTKSKVVKVGRIQNAQAEIVDGLALGDQIIVKGFQDLLDGVEVVVVQ